MSGRINEHGQPIGEDVLGWNGAKPPVREAIEGQYCRLEPTNAGSHAQDLYNAFALDQAGQLWTYMPVGPFESFEELNEWIEQVSQSKDPLFFAIIDTASGRAIGIASYLRIDPIMGVIEAGNIAFSPQLQKTRMATEAMFLMMSQAFREWGYRRFEWKCDALNAPSRAAAKRLGYYFDGIFEQAVVYKGRNRDTAWFSVLDCNWPAHERAFLTWLDPSNFDAKGEQTQRLSKLIADERSREPQ